MSMHVGSLIAGRIARGLIGALSPVLVVSCSSELSQTAVQEAGVPQVALEDTDQRQGSGTAQAGADSQANQATQKRPQLIKRASLQLALPDLQAGVQQVEALLTQYQGDLLELADQQPSSRAPQQVDIKLRVPQGNLADMLDDLRGLGTVQEQLITAEDVSAQLVDLNARIRNLRKSEEALLRIMERSGAVADVLEVARELSTVRETIERTDAQFQALKDQVAYSTLSLTLVSSVPAASASVPAGETLISTWQTAGSALRELSVGLLQLLIWLLVFSPYGAIALLALWLSRRYWKRQQQVEES